MHGRIAQKLSAKSIGDDQAGIRREHWLRKVRRHGKKQPITELAIFRPLVVGTKIVDAGFDFDNPDLTAIRQRRKVCTAPIG